MRRSSYPWLAILLLLASAHGASNSPGTTPEGKKVTGDRKAKVLSSTPAKVTSGEKPKNPLDAIRKGMPVTEVRKLLGEPDKIESMEAPIGKAEVWTYTKEVSRQFDPVSASDPSTVVAVPQPTGPPLYRIVGGHRSTAMVHYVVEQVIEVLMFDDHLVVCKVSRQVRRL